MMISAKALFRAFAVANALGHWWARGERATALVESSSDSTSEDLEAAIAADTNEAWSTASECGRQFVGGVDAFDATDATDATAYAATATHEGRNSGGILGSGHVTGTGRAFVRVLADDGVTVISVRRPGVGIVLTATVDVSGRVHVHCTRPEQICKRHWDCLVWLLRTIATQAAVHDACVAASRTQTVAVRLAHSIRHLPVGEAYVATATAAAI